MLASAVAFSALLSIAPILLVALAIASHVVGDDRGRASVMEDLAKWVGEGGAQTIDAMLSRAASTERAGIASVVGFVVLLYASTRLFSTMKRALDQMWDVDPPASVGFTQKLWRQLHKRGLALAYVVLLAILISAAVLAKTAVLHAGERLGGGAVTQVVVWIGELAVSVTVMTVMFTILFKVLPDVRLAWHDAWRGALVTAVLFQLGTTLIALYLGHKSLDVLYGPGGGIVLLLLWVHYSAQVFFLGAAITGELARRAGRPIQPL
jgi:membrane protein